MFSFQRKRGLDELNRALLIAGIATLLAGLFFQYGTWPKILLTLIAVAALLFAAIRLFSANASRVYQQNMKYLTLVTAVRGFFRGKSGGQQRPHRAKKAKKNPTWSEIKHYKYLVCPQCAQRLRVPRGKGKLRVTCTRCGNRFETKS